MSDSNPIPPTRLHEPAWSFPKRIAFRFAFAFFAVFSIFEFSFPIAQIQALSFAPTRILDRGGATLTAFWERAFEVTGVEKLSPLWQDLVAFVGFHLCGPDAPIRPHPTGSGDTLCNWLGALTAATIALVLTLTWSLMARGSRDHRTLAPWLWVVARFFLASVMLGYGFAKVVPTQFQPPFLGRLLQPLGDFSPMGVLWTFMGSSTAYTIFAGASEVLGGVLLCFRRAATLGALVTAGVMTNVVALNFCYDVPVKLYAGYYLIIAVAIALPDARRLMDVLVLNRAAPARDLSRPFASTSLNVLATVLTIAWIADTAYTNSTQGLEWYRQSVGSRLAYANQGVYEIESFERDGVVLPPLITDESRWRRLVVESDSVAIVHSMTGSMRGFGLGFDADAKTLDLTPRPPRTPDGAALEGPSPRYSFRYEESEPGRFRFEGEFEGSRLVFVALRKTRDDFLLTSRGFHWISEDPFNR